MHIMIDYNNLLTISEYNGLTKFPRKHLYIVFSVGIMPKEYYDHISIDRSDSIFITTKFEHALANYNETYFEPYEHEEKCVDMERRIGLMNWDEDTFSFDVNCDRYISPVQSLPNWPDFPNFINLKLSIQKNDVTGHGDYWETIFVYFNDV